MKKKDSKRKEAQGRNSRRLGNLSQTKILTLLYKDHLTFKKLHERMGLSKPVLTTHLKRLVEKGYIERTLEKDETVYRLVSDEKIRVEIKADLFDMISWILPSFSSVIEKFVEDLTEAWIASGKEKAYEEKIFKPLQRLQEKVSEKSEEKMEEHHTIPESRIRKLSKKYPKAMKELLKEGKS